MIQGQKIYIPCITPVKIYFPPPVHFQRRNELLAYSFLKYTNNIPVWVTSIKLITFLLFTM
jgi:hypothetical protein